MLVKKLRKFGWLKITGTPPCCAPKLRVTNINSCIASMYDHRVDHATQIQTAVETAQLSSITQLSGSLKLYLTMKTNALKWGSEGEHAYNDHAGVITVASSSKYAHAILALPWMLFVCMCKNPKPFWLINPSNL